MSARDIPIVVEDLSSDEDRDICDLLSGEEKKQESVPACAESSFTFSLDSSKKEIN